MSIIQDLLASFSTSLFVQPFVNAVLPGRLVVPAINSPLSQPTSGPPAAACVAGPGQAVGKSATAASALPVKFTLKLVLQDDGEIQVFIDAVVNDSFNHELEVLVETSSKPSLRKSTSWLNSRTRRSRRQVFDEPEVDVEDTEVPERVYPRPTPSPFGRPFPFWPEDVV